MRNLWKYLARTAIAFSPTIVLFSASYMGVIRDTYGGLHTGVAIAQGIVLAPFIVWMWVDFRSHPEKYPAPGWLVNSIDLILVGLVAVVLVQQYLAHNN